MKILLLFVLSFLPYPLFASSLSSFPGNGVNDASIGTVPWTNPQNVVGNEGSNATISFVSPGLISDYLAGISFSFSIPAAATIDGVSVDVERSAPSGVTGDSSVILNVGSSTSTNKASGTGWPASDTVMTYGSSTDTWGLTLTPSSFSTINFKLAAICNGLGSSGQVDYYQMTVYYHIGSSDFIAVSQNYFD